MEISEIDKKKILEAVIDAQPDELLLQFGKRLEVFSFEDFFNIGSKPLLINVDQELRSYVTSEVIKRKGDTQTLAQLAASPYYYLQRAINNIGSTDILIMLFLNIYQPLEPEDWAKNLDYDVKEREQFTKCIIQILSSVGFKISAPKDAPYYEKKLLRGFRKSITQNNIKQAYDLVSALENGGKGFLINPLLTYLIRFFSLFNIDGFLEILQLQKSPDAIVFYLKLLDKEIICQLLILNKALNKWLIFELIRRLVKFSGTNEPNKSQIEAVNNGLVLLKDCDIDFLKQTIRYFNGSLLFNISLGKFMKELSVIELKTIVRETFNPDRYDNNIIAKTRLLNEFDDNPDNINYMILLSETYNLWEDFMAKCLVDSEFYTNDLVITDFGNFIPYYFQYHKKDSEIITQMVHLLKTVIYIDSEWFTSNSRQITSFHIYLSQIYLRSFDIKNRKIKSAEVLELANKLDENQIFRMRFLNHSKTDTIKKVLENVKF